MRSTHTWPLPLLTLVALSSATVSNWTKPSSQSPSFTDTYTVGERIFVLWQSLNNSIDDLWLTRYDPAVDSFALRLAVNATEVERDTRFILQFLPTGSAYNASQTPQLPSPPFNLINLNQVSPPNGTVGAPSMTPSVSASSSTQPAVGPPSSANQSDGIPPADSRTPGFSKSVAIGVSIGAVVMALASMIGALLVVRAYKRAKPGQTDTLGEVESESGSEHFKTSGPYEVMGTSRQPTEMSAKETAVHELNSSKETIVYESDSSTIHEMSTMRTTTKRPGLHELPG